MKRRYTSILTAAAIILVVTPVVEADIANPGDFGPDAIFESFEGLSAGYNISSGGWGWLEPGVIEPFTFASGATLTEPIPNPGLNDGVVIGDWSISLAICLLGDNGRVERESDVPFGSAYLVLYGSHDGGGPIELTFSTDMTRVGGYFTSHPGMITLTAFDASHNLLDTVSIASVNVYQWDMNFLGIQDVGPIRSIQLNGDLVVLDGLTAQEIPEPATLLLFALGGIALRKKH